MIFQVKIQLKKSKFRRETELVEVSLTASRVNSQLLRMQECRDESEIYNYTKGFNIQIMSLLIQSWGVRLTWLDCKVEKLKRFEKVSSDLKTILKTDLVDLRLLAVS